MLRKESKSERERAFIENGSRVLEKLVSICNGKPIPIRNFSFAELSKATNNFDPQLFICQVRPYQWYKGYLEGRTISIKRGKSDRAKEEVFTDLAFSAKVSAHKNVLKLVGCCLETPIVILVYEFVGKGTLWNRLVVSGEQMTRQSRLKMAREIANAISYLHTAFSRPIIHNNIEPQNIFIDCHGVPKLTGFSNSLIIPEGETHVKDDSFDSYDPKFWWTMRSACPHYRKTGCITEKTDVFSFGNTLLQILTKNTMVDPVILAGELRGAGVEQQIQAVRDLAFRCMKEEPMERPTMVDVTKELRRIEKSIP
ncbi:hypothetical protein F2P56_019037 [Juglans regia]|uniref:Protein kinase domain-containing protein n=2 Tax=Juglans regia TaxID=51240 RepID=A0A833V291_JUGRE|nr:non-functional pseudokinase ZRK2-like [Juglans regia]KAF5463094.1 hypothetical protein F2P56_019037 [Juglans regia]